MNIISYIYIYSVIVYLRNEIYSKDLILFYDIYILFCYQNFMASKISLLKTVKNVNANC